MERFLKIALFAILTTIMGFIAAGLIWFLLRLISLGTDLIWFHLPKAIGLRGSLIYSLPVCLFGGLLIGILQKKWGPLPDSTEQVIGKIRTEGRYPYDRFHMITITALLPLIFGGALGPEAGLSGLIAGLCCFIGDRLRYKGNQLAALAEAGFAATLGVIFRAPLFGIIGNLEPDNSSEKYKEKLVSKRTRIIIYCFGVLGAFFSFELLNRFLGSGGGLPRFYIQHGVGIDQWKWFLPLLAVGIAFSLYYQFMDRITSAVSSKIDNHIIKALIAGASVAVCGWFFPLSMFSGEQELHNLIDEWEFNSLPDMVISSMVKLLLICICINFGWRGGNIFPLIFCSALLGYSFAYLTGMDGAFAVAVVASSLYAYKLRKPATVIAILLLCFPITYIFPLGISAIAASKIPSPFSASKTSSSSGE